jgi:hypothetical protein
MSVIVINVADWPNFKTLVRAEALDLYTESAGVEFWDATASDAAKAAASVISAGRDLDYAVWGHWPKRLGASPTRVRGEVLDRIRHRGEDGVDRLTVIMVFDRIEQALPAAGSAGAGRGAQSIVGELHARIQSDAFLDSELRRVTFIAAMRFGGAFEEEHASAFAAVGHGLSFQAPLFHVAVFLDKAGRTFDRDHMDRVSFTALRVVIDIARDSDAARSLFSFSATTRQGRVLVLSPPSSVHSPAMALRREVVTLVDRALAVQDERAQEEGQEPIAQIVSDVLTRIDGSTEGKAVAKVAKIDEKTGKRAPTVDIDRLWNVEKPPSDPAWSDVVDVEAAQKLFVKSVAGVEAYRASRDARLQVQREKLDLQMRDTTQTELRRRIEVACVDPSFGLATQFIGRLDTQRARLVDTLIARSAAATGHRARRLELLDRERLLPKGRLVDPFDKVCDALYRWLPASVVKHGASLLGAVVAFISCALLFAPKATWWPLGLACAVGVIAAVGWFALYRLHSRREQRRSEAIKSYQVAQDTEIDGIREVSDEGLVQVVSARIAGSIAPFCEDLRRYARDSARLRDTMTDVVRRLRVGLPPADPTETPPPQTFASGGKGVTERFRQLLWTYKPAPPTPATIQFTDQRGALEFASSLRFTEPVTVDTPRPPAAPVPTPPAPTPPAPTPPAPTPPASTSPAPRAIPQEGNP